VLYCATSTNEYVSNSRNRKNEPYLIKNCMTIVDCGLWIADFGFLTFRNPPSEIAAISDGGFRVSG
jgi:hypothetical protein